MARHEVQAVRGGAARAEQVLGASDARRKLPVGARVAANKAARCAAQRHGGDAFASRERAPAGWWRGWRGAGAGWRGATQSNALESRKQPFHSIHRSPQGKPPTCRHVSVRGPRCPPTRTLYVPLASHASAISRVWRSTGSCEMARTMGGSSSSAPATSRQKMVACTARDEHARQRAAPTHARAHAAPRLVEAEAIHAVLRDPVPQAVQDELRARGAAPAAITAHQQASGAAQRAPVARQRVAAAAVVGVMPVRPWGGVPSAGSERAAGTSRAPSR